MSLRKTRLTALGIAVSTAVAACSSLPETIPELDTARTTVERFENDSLAVRVAGDDLEAARTALMRAERLRADDDDLAPILHNARLADTHASIGLERIAEAEAREQLEASEAERTRLQLEARTRESELAQRRAARSERDADIAERRAAQAIGQVRRLASELEELQAEETERGTVLTLGDVLFDTDSAGLKPGAESVLDRLAGFLDDNPGYRLRIEGHTDSRGSDAYNLALSNDRAEAVRDGLAEREIAPPRLQIVGLGESYPVATNETAAGRQQNRRVEIVVSDSDGDFPSEVRRVASADR